MPNSRDAAKIVLVQLRPAADVRELDLASYIRACRLPRERFAAVDVHLVAPSPDLLDGADALIIAGSRYSVWDDVPNLSALNALVLAARDRRIPIFGVCFGAQLLAQLFGGRVVRDEEKGEWGSHEMNTTDDALDDPVFTDLPFTFPAQQAHRDQIVELPAGATLLASSDKCRVQAFCLPDARAYGVQFHPERSKADYERILDLAHRDEAEKNALIRLTLHETPEAEAVLTRWIDRIVLPTQE